MIHTCFAATNGVNDDNCTVTVFRWTKAMFQKPFCGNIVKNLARLSIFF